MGFLSKNAARSLPDLVGVVQAVDGHRVDGADHLQHAVEVVELLKDLQNLDDARPHRHALLQVHGLHFTLQPHDSS